MVTILPFKRNGFDVQTLVVALSSVRPTTRSVDPLAQLANYHEWYQYMTDSFAEHGPAISHYQYNPGLCKPELADLIQDTIGRT